MKKLMAVTVIGLISCNTFANTDLGVSAGLIHLEGGGIDLNPSMISIHIENQINPNLILEGRASLGVSEDTIDINSFFISAELNHAVGVSAKVSPNFNETISPYISIGYARASFSGEVKDLYSFNSHKITDTESDLLLGVGLRASLDERITGFMEINKFSESDILNFGIIFKY